MASRRKRGPVALRPRVYPGLPLSDVTLIYLPVLDPRQFVNLHRRCRRRSEIASRVPPLQNSVITNQVAATAVVTVVQSMPMARASSECR